MFHDFNRFSAANTEPEYIGVEQKFPIVSISCKYSFLKGSQISCFSRQNRSIFISIVPINLITWKWLKKHLNLSRSVLKKIGKTTFFFFNFFKFKFINLIFFFSKLFQICFFEKFKNKKHIKWVTKDVQLGVKYRQKTYIFRCAVFLYEN